MQGLLFALAMQASAAGFAPYQEEAVNGAPDAAFLFQALLHAQQPVEAALHGEAGKLPGKHPGEPYERAHVIKKDGAEGFAGLLQLESRRFRGLTLLCQRVMGKRLFQPGKHHFHQIPVVLCAHLFGDPYAAGAEDPVAFLEIVIAMPVDEQVKSAAVKGKPGGIAAGPEINAQGQQAFTA